MRISYIKDFRKGDRVKYLFPNPKIKGRDFIFGTVSRVSRASLEIRSDEFKMNLLQKHLDNIVYVERQINCN